MSIPSTSTSSDLALVLPNTNININNTSESKPSLNQEQQNTIKLANETLNTNNNQESSLPLLKEGKVTETPANPEKDKAINKLFSEVLLGEEAIRQSNLKDSELDDPFSALSDDNSSLLATTTPNPVESIKESLVEENPSTMPSDVSDFEESSVSITKTQENPIDLPGIQTKANELSKASETSTQKCLQDLIKKLDPNNKNIKISSSLQKQNGKYLVEPFSPNNSTEICYKIKATYTLKTEDGKSVEFERHVYTTATDPEQAIFAASAYKDAMAKLAKNPQDEVMNQSVFKLHPGTSGTPSLSYQTSSNTYQNLNLPLKQKNVNYYADINHSDKKIKAKDIEAEIPLSRKVIYKSKQEAIRHRGYIINNSTLEEKIRANKPTDSDLILFYSDIQELQDEIKTKKDQLNQSILNEKNLPTSLDFEKMLQVKTNIENAKNEVSHSETEEQRKIKEEKLAELENNPDNQALLKKLDDYQTALKELAFLRTLNQKLINKQIHLKTIENIISPKSSASTVQDKVVEGIIKLKEFFNKPMYKDFTSKKIEKEAKSNNKFIQSFIDKLGTPTVASPPTVPPLLTKSQTGAATKPIPVITPSPTLAKQDSLITKKDDSDDFFDADKGTIELEMVPQPNVETPKIDPDTSNAILHATPSTEVSDNFENIAFSINMMEI